MTTISIRTMLLSLAVVVMMTAVESAGWRDWYDDDAAIEVPAYVWNRAARSRPKCVHSGQRCDSTKPCCQRGDICMTSPQIDSDGLRSTRCVTWSESLAISRRLPNGATCTDSWECADRCCREYRAHRHDVVLECGTPFDGLEWHTCVTEST
uniref:WAP domain-containing protein n=1 Tax=Arion vulgaris TaxID=1028688 RepID=A0A0B6Z6M8_9EUPU